ncbi:hypothetical protein SAMN04487916_110124 [Arthrobacter sp. ov407]|uniref:hypothetical protein n=1 Tax=Arthrobacter sp. ov407 TaxID=1761748 RepID=UPI0008802B89|nr:hypothetical protein [Arthrobacter sp. ov407]SDL55194.1 hypothetical protein SAMN04487916_110124 [Arthrobacter sp. ov407]
MTERADFDARKESESFGGAQPAYGQLWPDGAPWPDSSDHRPAQLPALPVPRIRAESLENSVRGTVFALAVVPVGVALWLILWKLGWIGSIVAFLTAAGAARLYIAGSTAGSGGTMTRGGAWVVVAVTIATVLLSFLGTIWLDLADYMGGASPLALLFEPEAWDLLGYNLANNADLVENLKGEFLMALLFSALGCFFTLRQLFAQSRRG